MIINQFLLIIKNQPIFIDLSKKVSLPQKNKMEIVSVVTGDFVNSSKGDDLWRRAMLSIVDKAVAEMSGYLGIMQLEFFRGDSFQILVERPENALRVAVLLRAALCSQTSSDCPFFWDARLAIGIGDVVYRSKDLAKSSGHAFIYSGRTLDDMKHERMAIRTSWESINEEFAVSTPFADDIISNWTVRQADLVYDSLLYDVSQFRMAVEREMSAQNVSKILKAAKIELIKNYLHRFESLIYDRI